MVNMVKFFTTWRWGGFYPQGLAIGALLVGISACSGKPSDSPGGHTVVLNDAGSTSTDPSNHPGSTSTDPSNHEPTLVTLGEFVGGMNSATGEFWIRPASEVTNSSHGGQAGQGITLSTYDSGTFGTGVTGTGSNYIALEQVTTYKVPQGSSMAWSTTNCGSPAPTSGICVQIRMRNLFPNQPIIRAYVEFTSLTAQSGTTGLTTRSYLTLSGIGTTDSDYGVTSANGGLFRYGRLARSGASSGNTASVYWPFTCTNSGGCSFSWRGVVKGQLLDPVIHSSLANGTSDLPSGTYGGGTVGNASSGQSVILTAAGGGGALGARTSMSQDGTYVAFQSTATNLTATSPGSPFNGVYRRNNQTGETILVSVVRTGTMAANQTNCHSGAPSISDDGTKIAFISTCQLDGVNDTNTLADVYVRDLTAGETYLVSVDNSTPAVQANKRSFNPYISGDGTAVVFDTTATNLDTGDPGSSRNVYWRSPFNYTTTPDDGFGQTIRISTTPSGGWPNNNSLNASVISNGFLVIFESVASDIDATDSNGVSDVFTYDLNAGTMTRVSVSNTGSQLTLASQNGFLASNTGEYLVFDTKSSVLGFGTSSNTQVYVRASDNPASVRLVSGSAGSQSSFGNGLSAFAVLSTDGRYVAYVSTATNVTSPSLASNPRNIFIYDQFTTDTQLAASNVLSVPETFVFNATTVGPSNFPVLGISGDGNYIAFPAGTTAALVGSSTTTHIYSAPTF
jgi:hypothetical protein